jgi:hypothetical protein
MRTSKLSEALGRRGVRWNWAPDPLPPGDSEPERFEAAWYEWERQEAIGRIVKAALVTAFPAPDAALKEDPTLIRIRRAHAR